MGERGREKEKEGERGREGRGRGRGQGKKEGNKGYLGRTGTKVCPWVFRRKIEYTGKW